MHHFFIKRQEKTMQTLRDIRFSRDKVNMLYVYENKNEDENFPFRIGDKRWGFWGMGVLGRITFRERLYFSRQAERENEI